MDNRANQPLHHELFSRGSTPPVNPAVQLQSQFGVQNPSSSIDTLFQTIATSGDAPHSQPPPQNMSNNADPYGASPSQDNTMSLLDEPNVTTPQNVSSTDRQNSLLSLLGGGPGPRNPPNATQQIPTPPGSSQRAQASPPNSETQGKILLETLMGGPTAPRSNFSDPQRGMAAPSPPYSTSSQGTYVTPDPAIEMAHRSQGGMSSTQQPPRSSMFDYITPFDALNNPTGSIKQKKNAPPPQTSNVSSEDSGSWTTVTDPKRQSVDNLLDTLVRQGPPQISQNPYDSYVTNVGGEFMTPEQPRAPLSFPKPTTQPPPRNPSPRGSPPKTQAIPRGGRFIESPAGQQGSGGARHNKESSPGPKERKRGGPGQGKGQNNKNQSSPSPHVQNIVFDVSQPLEEIQAPPDSAKSTAIALVRQDAVFLPGTTIGATHWVAYAMTKGRVRVISRSSGDRTLLQLPGVFPNTSSVSDMAVFGNRLAGVTSDGGFVVWELPETITDDVPGYLLLCVPPPNEGEPPLQSVKWHPKEADTLALTSDHQIYLIDLANTVPLRGQNISQSDLHHIGQVFPVPSPIVAFDFDLLHYALATMSADSTLTIWNIHDKLPFVTHKVRGEDIPSSLTFVDGGIVVGRKNGTIFQLLSGTTKAVLATIKFVNGDREDPDMFGHISYDSRIQTLWVANSLRASMIALKINLESSMVGGEEAMRGYFEQIVEFTGPKPTIHFVILTADADPIGDEAYAACVAAKVPPGELALVAFSVHSNGVDQILVRKEWYDAALASAVAKYPQIPSYPVQQPSVPQAVEYDVKRRGGSQRGPAPIGRANTPPSEDVEGDVKAEEGRSEPKPKSSKQNKNVNFRDKDESGNKGGKGGDQSTINDSALGQVLSREIKKSEDNLHTKLSRVISKEMDKQHQRLEEARAHEQAEDFARQEKILKLISTELTRNTTRVVEQAVKSEVQSSVLPALETITKTEVKAALSDQVSRVFADVLGQSLPIELEKLLMRPDMSPHISRIISSSLTPIIERHVKDTLTKTLIQQSTALHQELLNELRGDIHKLKAELMGWQSETLRSQEATIRELDRTVRGLIEQVKFLSMNAPPPQIHHIPQNQPPLNPPVNNPSLPPNNLGQTHLRQANIQPNLPPVGPTNYANLMQSQQSLPSNYFSPGIIAPQASHPATLPPPSQSDRTPPVKPEQWDEIYLEVLHLQDPSKLRELLARTNPELILPSNGPPLVSQAVILTLIHRLSTIVGEASPSDEAFKSSLWWLHRAAPFLRPEDKLIADFIPRVIPNVHTGLNNTKQRLAILPGGPQSLDNARMITDIQETIRRKVGMNAP